MIIAKDDTEKLGGYQEKNNALSGARKLSGLLWSPLEVTDETDGDATGDPHHHRYPDGQARGAFGDGIQGEGIEPSGVRYGKKCPRQTGRGHSREGIE
jgi:hypothetical protein